MATQMDPNGDPNGHPNERILTFKDEIRYYYTFLLNSNKVDIENFINSKGLFAVFWIDTLHILIIFNVSVQYNVAQLLPRGGHPCKEPKFRVLEKKSQSSECMVFLRKKK